MKLAIPRAIQNGCSQRDPFVELGLAITSSSSNMYCSLPEDANFHVSMTADTATTKDINPKIIFSIIVRSLAESVPSGKMSETQYKGRALIGTALKCATQSVQK
jgi:hypothetical protein